MIRWRKATQCNHIGLIFLPRFQTCDAAGSLVMSPNLFCTLYWLWYQKYYWSDPDENNIDMCSNSVSRLIGCLVTSIWKWRTPQIKSQNTNPFHWQTLSAQEKRLKVNKSSSLTTIHQLSSNITFYASRCHHLHLQSPFEASAHPTKNDPVPDRPAGQERRENEILKPGLDSCVFDLLSN